MRANQQAVCAVPLLTRFVKKVNRCAREVRTRLLLEIITLIINVLSNQTSNISQLDMQKFGQLRIDFSQLQFISGYCRNNLPDRILKNFAQSMQIVYSGRVFTEALLADTAKLAACGAPSITTKSARDRHRDARSCARLWSRHATRIIKREMGGERRPAICGQTPPPPPDG